MTDTIAQSRPWAADPKSPARRAGAIEPAAEQLELLPPSRFAPGSEAHNELLEHVKRDQPGRPIGARNLATRRMIEVVRRLFGDPMFDSARWLAHTPASLAAELGCTKLEAWDRLEKLRADLRPFMYARLAPVDGQGNAVAPRFELTIGGHAQGVDGRKPWEYEGGPVIEGTQQNQEVSADAEPVSYGGSSYGEVK